MRKIIITDLTRFNNRDIVCTAGIDLDTRQCIRPMPYLPSSECQRLNILPGAILQGEFSPSKQLNGPHQEDMNHKNLRFCGSCSSDDFKNALEAGLFDSVEDGFEIGLSAKQKHIPIGHPIERSIITIKVSPFDIKVVEDSYKPGKVKLHFEDQNGHNFRYMPISDLGFHVFAQNHREENRLHELNSFIQSQSEVYLRIGLSRSHTIGTIEGYWIQVNGLYTFPKYYPELRIHN